MLVNVELLSAGRLAGTIQHILKKARRASLTQLSGAHFGSHDLEFIMNFLGHVFDD